MGEPGQKGISNIHIDIIYIPIWLRWPVSFLPVSEFPRPSASWLTGTEMEEWIEVSGPRDPQLELRPGWPNWVVTSLTCAEGQTISEQFLFWTTTGLCMLSTDLSGQQLQLLQLQWEMPELVIHLPTCIPAARENAGGTNKSGARGRRSALAVATVGCASSDLQVIQRQTQRVYLRELDSGQETLWGISEHLLVKWPLTLTHSASLSGLFRFTTRKAQSWQAVGATEVVHFNPWVLQIGFGCDQVTALPFNELPFWSQWVGVIQQGLILLVGIPVSRTSICSWRWGFRDGAGPVVPLMHRQRMPFWGISRETRFVLPPAASQACPGISWARGVAGVQDRGGQRWPKRSV